MRRAIAVPVLVFLCLSLPGLRDLSVWDDEAAVVEYGKGSFDDILHRGDRIIPPLYFILIRGVRAITEDEVVLRLPAVLAAAAAIPLAAAIAARLAGPAAAFPAAWLAALSPLLLLYGREIRMYPLALLLGASATLLFRSAWIDRRGAAWPAYAAACALGLLTHQAFGLIPLGLFLFALTDREAGGLRITDCGLRINNWVPSAAVNPQSAIRNPKWSASPWACWLIAHLLVFLFLAPFAGPLLERSITAWKEHLAGSLQVPARDGAAARILYPVYTMILGETLLPWRWGLTVPAGAAALLLAAAGFRSMRASLPRAGSRGSPRGLRMILCLLVPGLILVGLSARPLGRYTFLLLPALWTLLAAGWASLGEGPPTSWGRLARIFVLCALGPPLAISLLNVHAGQDHHFPARLEPSREVARIVRENWKNGDIAVFSPPNPVFFHYYWPPSWCGVPRSGETASAPAAGSRPRPCSEFPTGDPDTAGRVWLVERSHTSRREYAARLADVEAFRSREDAARPRLGDWRFAPDESADAKAAWVDRPFTRERVRVTLWGTRRR